MNILMIGDVVGEPGCKALQKALPALKQKYNADVTIVNGENSAKGNGITPDSADHVFACGADLITGGNHSFRRREMYARYETDSFILRPANYPASAPGLGVGVIDKGRYSVGVVSLMGQLYLPATRCPFEVAEECIKELKDQGCKIIVLDIHAEATSEKKALGYELDGTVTAVLGTHTHVQTADGQILPCGTAYITDVGMCGPYESVLGVKKEQSIALLKDKLPVRFETAEGDCQVDGVSITVDEKTGLATHIEAFSQMVKGV
ncbi:MAG: TIGR00282 family metallophosphoesterase [Clostridia bacterium]|nr:TIGR00282 family metallophosphoesterase [Clostridia bacterium]